MSIRAAVSQVADRLNNADFRSPRQKQQVTQQLRERLGNALSEGEGRSERTREASGPNLRKIANRVVNSDLDRADKAQLLERIKNAAGGDDGSDPARRRIEADPQAKERVREAAYEQEGKRTLSRV